VDASHGSDRGRVHGAAPPAAWPSLGDGWHVIEQHAYADAMEAIETLDLVCPGFNPERVAASMAS
jgi:hypothetical protein